jgi:anti-anti-sigma factor
VKPLATVVADDVAGARVIRVSGEVDLSNAHALLEGISAHVPHDGGLVVLDLEGASYLDSTGVSMVFRLAERIRTRRMELRLAVSPESPVRAVLELTNVHRVIPLRASVEDAIRT